jgi:Glycosyl transferase family 2/Dolichyl-phosphate-mannose-protein mannosyltransferase
VPTSAITSDATTIPAHRDGIVARTRSWRHSLTWMVVIAFALRIIGILLIHSYKFRTAQENFGFGWEMGRIARAIAAGEGFSNPFHLITGPTAWEPPLYPYLIASIFKMFGTYSHLSAFILLAINSLFSALTCIPIYYIAKKCFDEKVALWSAWTWAVLPYVMYWSVRWVWETSLTAFLLALLFLFTLELENRGWRAFAGFGTLWGVTALANPTCLSFLPFSFLWVWWRKRRSGNSGVPGLVLAATIFAALISPWLVRNYEVFGRFVFLRDNFGAELRMGNGPDADGTWMWYLHPTQNILQMKKYRDLGELAYVAERKHEAVEFIRHNPGRFLVLSFRKFVYFWAGVPRSSEIPELAQTKNSLFLASSVLAIWGLFRALRKRIFGAPLFAALMFAYPLVYYLVFAHPRYRHPIEPEMLILGVFLIMQAETKESRARAAAVAKLFEPMGPGTTLSIVIPAYNEQATIAHVLHTVLDADAGLAKEIIVVDDCSKDGTRDILRELERESNGRIKLVFHQQNQGKGAALRSGFQHASGDIVVVQDADLEYDPKDYPALLEPILNGRADVVFGNRFHGGAHRVLYFWHFQANQFLTLFCNLLTNLNLTDMEVGYKAFRREVLERITLRSNRFGFEPEVTIKIAKLGCRIYEVPIAYHGRTYEEGKKIGWKDGVAALWHMIKYRFLD